MRILSEVIWLLGGGAVCAMLHSITGIIAVCSIAGIPMGLQHFKMASLCVYPFGKEIVEIEDKVHAPITVVMAPFTFTCAGAHLLFATLNFASVFGIVFAEQHFRLAFISCSMEEKRIIPNPINSI